MNRVIYSLLFYLAIPIIFLRLFWRSLSSPVYRKRWRERLGFYAADQRFPIKNSCIIFHAVSVGEVHAAKPLIDSLQQDHPNCSIVITTSTATGSERVTEIYGDSVFHIYLPYDLPGAVQRFLRVTKPDLLVIMETELWPNLIYYCGKADIKILLANARLSEKSFKSYSKIGGLTKSMLAGIDIVAAQAQADGEYFLKLGLVEEKLQITGNMKFDIQIPEEIILAGKDLRQTLGIERPVWIAASTRDGEDEKVLTAFKLVLHAFPDTLLLLVPRHPQRFNTAFDLCRSSGLNVARRSDGTANTKDIQIFLGDSMGEMLLYYSASDMAFVGGSLVDTGCQNILEPAALGLPVITGPSLYNFQAVSEILIQAGAMKVIANEKQLAATVISLLQNQEEYQAMSAAAAVTVRHNRGATEKLSGLCHKLLSE